MGWYLGYDGPACVTLTREGDDIIVAITFGPEADRRSRVDSPDPGSVI